MAQVKGRIRAVTGWQPSGVRLVVASSMVAGLVTTTVINPADVCRAYMQVRACWRWWLVVGGGVVRWCWC
jgi:hypothetical protein